MKLSRVELRRFFSKVEIERASDCWNWLGTKPNHGYGQVRLRGKMYPAHALSYLAFSGPIPSGCHIDHLCRNHSCVNPAHLEPVTPVFEGDEVAEGEGYFGTGTIHYSEGPKIFHRHWFAADGVHFFPEPTHWKPVGEGSAPPPETPKEKQ